MEPILFGFEDCRPGHFYGTTLAGRIRSYLDAKYTERLKLSDAADYFHIHPNQIGRAHV